MQHSDSDAAASGAAASASTVLVARGLLVRIVQMLTCLGASMRVRSA